MKSKNEIRKLLSVVPGLDHNAALTYHYLAHGITNENYRLNLDGVEYALRINNPDSDRLGLDRKNEISIMEKVAHIHLAPEHIFYSQEHNFSLSKWLPGTTWNKAEFEKNVNLNRLAQLLKQLHALPCHDLPRIDFLQRIDLYRIMIQQRHGALPAIEQRILPLAINLLGSMFYSLPECLCHNDLLSANILTSENDNSINNTSPLSNYGKIYFLDWEYAAVNDPLFELAVICQGNRLSKDAQQYLIQAYLGDKADQFSNEFNGWCWLYDYLSLLWGLVILPKDVSLPENLNQLFQQLMETLPNR